MKNPRIALLTVSVGLGMFLVVLCIIAGRSASTMAASQSNHVPHASLQELDLPMYQTIYCTLDITTTDLLGANNYTYTSAVRLANYTGLALAVGNVPTDPITAPASDDWFRIDNTTFSERHSIDAIPDQGTNYNLGIVVYDWDLTPIISDTSITNHSASVELVADCCGPYYLKVFQISPHCTGGTYHLDYSVESPTPTPRLHYIPLCTRNKH